MPRKHTMSAFPVSLWAFHSPDEANSSGEATSDGRRLGVIPVYQRKSARSAGSAFYFEVASGWPERHGMFMNWPHYFTCPENIPCLHFALAYGPCIHRMKRIHPVKLPRMAADWERYYLSAEISQISAISVLF